MSGTTRRLAFAGAIVVALAVVFGVWRTARPARVGVARVARRPLTQTLVVSGRVMPPVRVNIGAIVAGIVVRRLVEDGQRVRAGQVLLVLDDAETRAAAAQARAAVSQATVKLEQLRSVGLPLAVEGLTQARLTFDRAERELQRVQKLADEGIVTATELDDARKAVAMARSQREAASVQQAGISPAGVEERTARAALEQARAAEAAARARLGQMTIRASGDGVIIGRSVEAGDIVQPGTTLLVLAVDGPTLLTIEPDERNLSVIWMGQSAIASADAFPDQSFPATVGFIGAAVDPQRGTVEVRLSVSAPPPTLRPDMTVSVELEAGKHNEALSAPADCVRDVTGRAPWILVLKDGIVARRAARTGLRGDAFVEILSGAREGDLLIPASAGNPAPGTRLTAVLEGR
ncbi:MAG TPA: efflux RND transporter periplasmic adaptor subunit [Vicinamibacterales bacterium]